MHQLLALFACTQVPCEWALKRPIDNAKAKDWAFFRLEPQEGTLEPDQRLNVRVVFTPVLGRESAYNQVGMRAGCSHRRCGT